MKKVCKKWNVMIMIFCLIFTMMPVTAFAADATTLTLSFETDNEGQSDLISIASVSYDVEGGEVFTSNPNTITVPDEDSDKFDATKYVPVRITDTDGNQWVLTDKGKGERKNINVKETSSREFHYQLEDSENPPAPTLGGITITKVITGDVPESDATFTFSVARPEVYSNDVTITGEGSATINGLAPGTYTITENDVENYTEPASQDVVVEAGKIAPITFTNIYADPDNPTSPTLGGITITKVITGDVPESDATFTFNVVRPEAYSDDVTITGEGNTTINGLAPGTYTITETDVENYTEPASQDVVVAAGTTAAVTFTNIYTEPENPPAPTLGGITITKEITGDTPESAQVFTFNVVRPEVYSDEVTITGEGNTTINGLTPGTYTITESDVENYTEPNPQNVEVKAGTIAAITFTNNYTEPENPPEEDGPEAYVTKTVAEYDGVNLPSDSAFTDNLKLAKLNRSVIFKITLSCNAKWVQEEIYTGFEDFYGTQDITDDLLVLDNGEFVKATEFYWDFPHPIWLSTRDKVFYFIDTLEKEGTYTNTANILTYISEVEDVVEASSSAIVTVKAPDDDDETPDNPPSHHHHDNNNDSSTTTVVPPADNIQPPAEPAAAPAVELDDVPKTGNDTPVAPFMFLGALSAAILSFLGRKYWAGTESK